MSHTVTIVIPAYNEQASVRDIIAQTKAISRQTHLKAEIIVVDDGSQDETYAEALKTGVKVIRHASNRGYGAALKSGITAAKNDIIVIMDADGTYPAATIPLLVEKMADADMVVAARKGANVAIPILRRPAKWLLTKLAGYIVGGRIPDLNSGLRAFRKSVVQHFFSILSDKFSFTTTITVAMLCNDYKVEYITIDYFKRLGKSKITPWNFIEFLTLVIRLSILFRPLKIFLPISFSLLSFGFFKLLFDFIIALNAAGGLNFSFLTHKVVSQSALILLFSGLQILLIGMMADGLIRKISQIDIHQRSQHR